MPNPYPRIWYRDVATNELNGPLQQPGNPPRGQVVVLESDIRAVFPLGVADATHVYPTGTILSALFLGWVDVHERTGAEARPANTARSDPVAGSASKPAGSQTWQAEVRESYGRVYSSADLSKIRDALVYALSGLNRFLRGGRYAGRKGSRT